MLQNIIGNYGNTADDRNDQAMPTHPPSSRGEQSQQRDIWDEVEELRGSEGRQVEGNTEEQGQGSWGEKMHPRGHRERGGLQMRH